MEPASAISTLVSAADAAKAIKQLLAHSNELAKDDAQYYATYLAVAGKAVEGLEGEYLSILRQAADCDLQSEEDASALRKRITDYIHGEILRPRLKEAIDRLRRGREALLEHAERLLLWPKVKEKRVAAIEIFDQQLNELEGYLGSLGDYEGPSAAALDDLKTIQMELSRKPLNADSFEQLINDLLMNLNKSVLISTTGDCGRVIEALRIAFR